MYGTFKATLLFFLISLLSCNPCSRLQRQDRALLSSFDAIKAQYQAGGLSREGYTFELKKLQEREERLFEKVRNCEFEDQLEYNYWYRSRLKFPSRIQTELDLLEKL